MKPRIAAYVPADVVRRLELATERAGAAKSDIVAEALDRFPCPAGDKRLGAIVLNGRRELSGDRRGVMPMPAVAEALALFAYSFLTVRRHRRNASSGPPAGSAASALRSLSLRSVGASPLTGAHQHA